MPNVQLVPFQVEGITENTLEVPRGIRMIRARSIWREGFKGENIVVAVIDTGCQSDHPDLIDQIIGGYNFTDDYYGDPVKFADNNGHGTHVCGTIAAAENGFGVVGAAPKAKLLVLKVLNGSEKEQQKTLRQLLITLSIGQVLMAKKYGLSRCH